MVFIHLIVFFFLIIFFCAIPLFRFVFAIFFNVYESGYISFFCMIMKMLIMMRLVNDKLNPYDVYTSYLFEWEREYYAYYFGRSRWWRWWFWVRMILRWPKQHGFSKYGIFLLKIYDLINKHELVPKIISVFLHNRGLCLSKKEKKIIKWIIYYFFVIFCSFLLAVLVFGLSYFFSFTWVWSWKVIAVWVWFWTILWFTFVVWCSFLFSFYFYI